MRLELIWYGAFAFGMCVAVPLVIHVAVRGRVGRDWTSSPTGWSF